MKTLILFSTRDGQTREIASYLASELKSRGLMRTRSISTAPMKWSGPYTIVSSSAHQSAMVIFIPP